MEAIRQIIDSNLLNKVMPLPKYFQNKKVEVTVVLKEEQGGLPKFTEKEIEAMLKGSITESLIGILPHSEKSLEDYREERLKKYEIAD